MFFFLWKLIFLSKFSRQDCTIFLSESSQKLLAHLTVAKSFDSSKDKIRKSKEKKSVENCVYLAFHCDFFAS